jgi:hypothetical protein
MRQSCDKLDGILAAGVGTNQRHSRFFEHTLHAAHLSVIFEQSREWASE